MNNRMKDPTGSTGADAAASGATRACGAPNAFIKAGVTTPADPIFNRHNGSEQELGAAGPAVLSATDPWSRESAIAHGEAIIAPAPNATANAPTRPT
jgi:hypothetical protein